MSGKSPLPSFIALFHLMSIPVIWFGACALPNTSCCFGGGWLVFSSWMLRRWRDDLGFRVTRGTKVTWLLSYLYWAAFAVVHVQGYEMPHRLSLRPESYRPVFFAVLLLAFAAAFTSILAYVCEGEPRHDSPSGLDLLAHYPLIRS